MIKLTLQQVCVGKKCRRIPHNQNHNLHWAARYKWNEEWKAEVHVALAFFRKQLGKLPWGFTKIKLVFKSVQEIDYDNLYACAKPLIDALKIKGGYGVIIDDKKAFCSIEAEWQKAHHRVEEGVEIFLERG